jgi:hypothetical protein
LATDPNLSSDFGGRITFGHSPEQQDRLGRAKIPPFKDRPAVEIVGALTHVTPVDHQLTGFGLPKFTGLSQSGITVRAFQPIRMKVFEQPLTAQFVIQ